MSDYTPYCLVSQRKTTKMKKNIFENDDENLQVSVILGIFRKFRKNLPNKVYI